MHKTKQLANMKTSVLKTLSIVIFTIPILIKAVMGLSTQECIPSPLTCGKMDLHTGENAKQCLQDLHNVFHEIPGSFQLSEIKIEDSLLITDSFCVTEICNIPWVPIKGLPYVKVPGANLGAASFTYIDSNRIAFLCDATNEVVIVSLGSNKIVSRFNVDPYSQDIVFDNGKFYILNDNRIMVYNEIFEIDRIIPYSTEYNSTNRVVRYKNATYLLLPNNHSLLIEKDGAAVEPYEINGLITNNGNFFSSSLNSPNSFSIGYIKNDSTILLKEFMIPQPVAGVFIVGGTIDRVIIDLQLYISEAPVIIDRKLIAIEFADSQIGAIISVIDVPDCYYTFTNKDFYVGAEGLIYHMVSSPLSTYVFTLKECDQKGLIDYPEYIRNINYHFNYHLLRVD